MVEDILEGLVCEGCGCFNNKYIQVAVNVRVDIKYTLTIDYVDENGNKLAESKQVYLIRNDEKATRYKLTEFGGPRGFMPDFILYLENEEFVYQVFIEPKGEDREKEDAWKQEMLYALNGSDVEIIGENGNVKLVGIKFYNNKNKREFVNELSEKINDGEVLDGKLELFSGE
ncbi:hypothetical protein ACMDZ0_002382 [Enterococcus hirae]